MSTRCFPTLTGVQVGEDRSLPSKLVDAVFQLYRRFYDLQDAVNAAKPAAATTTVVVSPDGTVTISGPRAEMNLFPAADYAIGSRYLITDWTRVEYAVQDVDAEHAWVYVAGSMLDVAANRPTAADLGALDFGFPFCATDTRQESYWDGTSWVDRDGVLGRAALTNSGAIPKVSATPGTLEESAIADDGSEVTVTGRKFRTTAGNGQINGTLKVTGVDNPGSPTGAGPELRYVGGESNLFSYNRNTSTRLPQAFDASAFRFDNGKVGFGKTAAHQVDSVGDINTDTGYRVAGNLGLASSRTVVYAVVPITTTLNYKDHAGANQSMTVQTGTLVSTTTHGFTGGILTL